MSFINRNEDEAARRRRMLLLQQGGGSMVPVPAPAPQPPKVKAPKAPTKSPNQRFRLLLNAGETIDTGTGLNYNLGLGLAGNGMFETTNGAANWAAGDVLYLAHDGAVADNGAGDAMGFWTTSAITGLASTLAASGLDVQMTFTWESTADTAQEAWFIGLSTNPAGTTNNQQPGFIGVGSDRNNNRMLCGRGIQHDGPSTDGIATFANGTSLHTLVGGELTADGATVHSIGFKILNSGGVYAYVPYFDGVAQVVSADLANAVNEDDVAAAVDRISLRLQYANITGVHTKFRTFSVARAGLIYA